MNKLLERALEAHGGLDRWKQFRTVATEVVSAGELLDRKVKKYGGALRTSASIHEQATLTAPVGGSDKRISFRPDRVAVETMDGTPVMERFDPRSAFTGHDLDDAWDPLHRAYFAGYAMWGYLTSPFSFSIDGAQVWDVEPLEENGELWHGIRVVLPSQFATHSRAQEYYFGDDMLLRRQDYTVDVAGGHRIANYALDIVDVNGFKLPSKRRAYLCNKKYDVLRDRLLISLDMSNFSVSA